jgi:hypothetical protein
VIVNKRDFKNPHEVQINLALDLLEEAVDERIETIGKATPALREVMMANDKIIQQAKRAGDIYGKLSL